MKTIALSSFREVSVLMKTIALSSFREVSVLMKTIALSTFKEVSLFQLVLNKQVAPYYIEGSSHHGKLKNGK